MKTLMDRAYWHVPMPAARQHRAVLAFVAAVHVLFIVGLMQWRHAQPAMASPPRIIAWLAAPEAAAEKEPRPAPPLPALKPVAQPRALPRLVDVPRVPAHDTAQQMDERVPSAITSAVQSPAPESAAQPVVTSSEPAPQPVSAPRFDLAYLNNPSPAYPAASRRAGEQGKALLRVLVSAAGEVLRIELAQSSGFERLDQAALDAVRTWRFVPARRGELAVQAWALVPLSFRLNA